MTSLQENILQVVLTAPLKFIKRKHFCITLDFPYLILHRGAALFTPSSNITAVVCVSDIVLFAALMNDNFSCSAFCEQAQPIAINQTNFIEFVVLL